jgi:hypothetical protein
MEKGTVIDNVELGRIRPDSGGDSVNFGPNSVRPQGSWPSVNNRVEFERYVKFPAWAKVVRVV